MSGESLPELNDRLLDEISRIDGLSGLNGAPVHLDLGLGESAAADLSPRLSNGIKGAVSYASRLPSAIIDKAISDDFIVFQFDTEQLDFKGFCRNAFLKVVTAFRPYRASVVADLDQDLDDFEQIVSEARRTGRDVDGRDSVYRLHPINYFDSAMCQRAFGVVPEQLAGRLDSRLVCLETFEDGVLLEVSSEPSAGLLLSEVYLQKR